MKRKRIVIRALTILLAGYSSLLIFAADQTRSVPQDEQIIYDPRVRQVPGLPQSNFIRLADGSLLSAHGNQVFVSGDNGETWDTRPMLSIEGNYICSEKTHFRLIRTEDGVIIALFMDLSEQKSSWNKEEIAPNPDMYLPVWSARSFDEGETWVEKQLIYDGYCGALMDVIQTSNGNIVTPMQETLYKAGRNVTRPYVSQDNGKTWIKTNFIDIGGRGHHDGSIEASLVELEDGRLWMLLRTSVDYLLSAYSHDQGLTWTEIRNSGIDASSSPAYITMLSSGKLALVWSRLFPEGESKTERRDDPQFHAKPASWHRTELSIALSDDDGNSWTQPVVIARNKNPQPTDSAGWLSYPYIFEYAPGEIWVTTGQGELKMALSEKDFTGPGVEKVKY